MKKITLVLLWLYFSSTASGQKLHSSEFIPNYSPILEFTDSINKSTTSIDIRKYNPYGNLNYPILKKDDRGNISYQINKQDFDELFPIKERESYMEKPEYDSIKVAVLHTDIMYSIEYGFLTVVYQLRAVENENDERIIGAKNRVIIFDKQHSIIYDETVPFIDGCALSPNGDLLVIKSEVSWPDGTLIENSINIIDLGSNKLVFKSMGGITSDVVYVRSLNLIQASVSKSGIQTMLFINTEINTLFLYEFSIKEQIVFTNMSSEGLIFRDENNQESILRFSDMKSIKL